MIPGSATSLDSPGWQEQLTASIRHPKELFDYLELDGTYLREALAAHSDFQVRAPHAYLRRIRKGDPNDPLLRQILPVSEELLAVPGYSKDPLAEQQANPVPGLIHKYHGRLLLVVSPNCAVNCRYCFRRHFPYQENRPARPEWQNALDYIARDASISEVIYSGGDPLVTGDNQLRWLTEQIAGIRHVKRLRIHTRLPVVIPDRITDSCLQWLTGTRLQTSMVIHSNHPNELDDSVGSSLLALKSAGITVMNQSVLMAGINDDTDTLAQLSERLFEFGTLPYYLHQLDKISGAAHFEVSDETARQLHSQLLVRLPGYLVPKLVREIPGSPSKVPLT